MKKKLVIGISISIAIMLAVGMTIFYNNKTKNKIVEVGNYKRWKVYFDSKVFPEGISPDSLSIVDSKGERVKVEVIWGNDQNSFFMLPPENGYELNHQYVLRINSNKGVRVAGIESNTENISFKIRNEKNLDKQVTFKDKGLEKAVREKTGKMDGKLTKGDLLKVTELNARERGIKNIDGIKNMANLNQLYLDVNEIKDISELEYLTDLNELGLSRNHIKDVSSLNKLVSLDVLALNGNEISDLSSLKNIYEKLQWKDFEME